MKDIYVTQPLLPNEDDYIKQVKEIFKNKWLTNMGEKHQLFEKELKEYLEVKDLSLMVNGHMALELSLQALNLNEALGGDGEVITTPFTFISTTHAITRNNLNPVFADIDPKTCLITPETIEPLINEKTVAIMPVHVYGNICDIKGIEKLAKKHELKVIYDAAHAFGEKIKLDDVEYGICSYGDISVLSFHATKVFNTIEGGCACFSDERLAKRFYNLKNFGITYKNPDSVEAIGSNAKMNEFQAAMGLCNLKLVDQAIEKRKVLAEFYKKQLEDINGLTLPTFIQSNLEITKRNYAYMPVIFNSETFGPGFRDKVMKNLANERIFSRKYFFPLTNNVSCYKEKFEAEGKTGPIATPTADKIAKDVLTLPMYADLKIEDVERICKVIKKSIS